MLKYSIKEITALYRLKYLNNNNTVSFVFEISKVFNNSKAGYKFVPLCKILNT